ncbi:hypothetical protein BC332_29538 [Capsicum chinense]|nr:hypothetical protein BC332_29538 [Capsicum chinense]
MACYPCSKGGVRKGCGAVVDGGGRAGRSSYAFCVGCLTKCFDAKSMGYFEVLYLANFRDLEAVRCEVSSLAKGVTRNSEVQTKIFHRIVELRDTGNRKEKEIVEILDDEDAISSDKLIPKFQYFASKMAMAIAEVESSVAKSVALDTARDRDRKCDGGQGESMICTKRMPHLAERWKSLETVIAAECQALTLQSLGNLKEAQELLERCLDARRVLLPEDHIQIAANLLHLARVKIVKILAPNKLKKSNASQDLLSKSISPSLSRFGTGNLSNLTQFVIEKSLSDAPGVKAEYILCLKHLVDLLTDNKTSSKDRSSNAALQELKDEIKRVQVDLSKKGGRRS